MPCIFISLSYLMFLIFLSFFFILLSFHFGFTIYTFLFYFLSSSTAAVDILTVVLDNFLLSN